jgi:hypothetical protein
MKKQTLLAVTLLISAAYAISAAKRFGFWGLAFFFRLGCRVLVGQIAQETLEIDWF